MLFLRAHLKATPVCLGCRCQIMQALRISHVKPTAYDANLMAVAFMTTPMTTVPKAHGQPNVANIFS